MKTGHWLGASPRTQFWAQLFGSLWATPLSVGLYVLFSKAYPCINDDTIDTCQFGAPSVAAWKAVATAVVSPDLPISLSSGLTAIIGSVIAIATVVAKYKWIPQSKHHWLANFNGIALGFLVPNVNYGIAMATGAIFVHFWTKKYPKNADIYAFAVCSGLISGEGIGGGRFCTRECPRDENKEERLLMFCFFFSPTLVVNAILQIAGIQGTEYGTTVGIPPWQL